MRIWTYTELKTKVENDLDMASESFVATQEWIDLFNEAVDEAEAEIHALHEDYFFTHDTITLVNGTSGYALPSDIYGQKVRGLAYLNGSTLYEILPYRRHQKFLKILHDGQPENTSADYRYYMKNASAAAGVTINLVPTPQESGAYVQVAYIRNANRFTGTGSTPLDIPEFANFVLEYVKAKIRQKENGGVMPQDSAALVQQQRDMMTSTLSRMADDDHDTVEPDFTHYEEHA